MRVAMSTLINWHWYLWFEVSESGRCVTIHGHDRLRYSAPSKPLTEQRFSLIEDDDRIVVAVRIAESKSDWCDAVTYAVSNPQNIFSYGKTEDFGYTEKR